MRTLGFLLAMQADGAPAPVSCARRRSRRHHQEVAVVAGFRIRSRGPGHLLDRVVGNHSLQALVVQPDQAQSSRFIEIFRRSAKFSEVQAVCQSLNDSPLVGIFLAGYAELNLQLRQPGPAANPAGNPTAPATRPVLKSLVSVDRALMRASNVETNKLEKHITFLATTAAVTPFIGLFGTVLGIVAAFQEIGAQGSTSLDVVAPGIADALIATAAGLAAAIPAVYFYNLLTQRVKALASEMDDFSLEFLNIVERNFT